MFERIRNNIKHDISANYALIVENAGYYKGMAYLSRVSFMLCKAIVLNKRRTFHDVEFYDIW